MVVLVSCATTSQTEAPETNASTSIVTSPSNDPLWTNATYLENTTLGEGAKTITVVVEAGNKKVVFTVKTDENNLGAALTSVGLIEGSQGPYGLMVEKVNGIQAIYDKDSAYWSLSINGEYAMSGADTTPIEDGNQFEWTYTKG
jgi:hypothetical protein